MSLRRQHAHLLTGRGRPTAVPGFELKAALRIIAKRKKTKKTARGQRKKPSPSWRALRSGGRVVASPPRRIPADARPAQPPVKGKGRGRRRDVTS